MFPIQRILVPVNFTEACRAAAVFAIELGGRLRSEVCLIHVLEPAGSAIGFETAAMFEAGIQAQRELAHSQLSVFPGPEPSETVQRILLAGDPASEIVRVAHNENFDLILMPTRGYGVFRRLLLGSVTAKVLHDSDCPVWTGVHPESFNADGDVSVQRVACAVDLGPQTASVIKWASSFAAKWNAELILIHMLAPVADADWRDRLSRMAREQLSAVLTDAGISAELYLDVGEMPASMPRVAKQLSPSVIVIGRGHVGPRDRLGRGAYAIVRDSPCAVVSV